MKYILYIDYRANATKAYEYIPMTSKNLLGAIAEADAIHNPETMYLVKILEKVGKVEKENDYKVQDYKAVMCKRTNWRLNNDENGEHAQYARRCYNKNFETIEAI